MKILLFLFVLFNACLSARSVSFFRYNQYEKIAENLMQIYELEGNYSHLQKNLTYFLQNFIAPAELPRINLTTDNTAVLDIVFRNNFWSQKLERDLENPYTDEDFNDYLSNLQKEVNVFLAYLTQINQKNSPLKISIFGSFAKGRFGGSSSLNLNIESKDEALLLKLENGPYSKTSNKFRGNIEILGCSFKPDFLLEPFKKVSIDQLRDVDKLYTRFLDEIGFGIKGGQLVRKTTPARAYLEFNPIEDRLFFLHNQLNALEKQFLDSFYEIFAGKETEKYQELFEKQFDSMYEKLSEVLNDLKLIEAKNEANPRYQKIKEVISSASLDRMVRHRFETMKNLVGNEFRRVSNLKLMLDVM
jgi:hypothetical protein